MKDPSGWRCGPGPGPPLDEPGCSLGAPLVVRDRRGFTPEPWKPTASFLHFPGPSPFSSQPLSLSSSFRKILSSFRAALAVSELEFQDLRPPRMGAQRKGFSSVRPRRQEARGFLRAGRGRGTPGFPRAAREGPQLEARACTGWRGKAHVER